MTIEKLQANRSKLMEVWTAIRDQEETASGPILTGKNHLRLHVSMMGERVYDLEIDEMGTITLSRGPGDSVIVGNRGELIG